jgi:hypothetical protein
MTSSNALSLGVLRVLVVDVVLATLLDVEEEPLRTDKQSLFNGLDTEGDMSAISCDWISVRLTSEL